MVWDVVKIGVEDVQKAFGIEEDLYQKYVEGEIKKNLSLMSLIQRRDGDFDWTKETPLGGAGTTLNGCALYCLIRHYNINFIIETGVSGGYYSSFMLAARIKNGNNGIHTALEISEDMSKIGHLIPEGIKNTASKWDLRTGKSSLEWFIKWSEHQAGLYCHDSLHTMSHMLKELNEFKKSQSNSFCVFIDDEKSDNFWQRCLKMGAFQKPGYSVQWISGTESRLQGHLGGFLRYEKMF